MSAGGGPVFISHVDDDAAVALEIVAALQQAGWSTWCYELDAVPGPSYLVQTSAEIERSSAVIVLVSARSLESRGVFKEMARALESGKPIVPLLLSISDAELADRVPEWRRALGSAKPIAVSAVGVAETVPRILGELRALGVEAGDRGLGSTPEIEETRTGPSGLSVLETVEIDSGVAVELCQGDLTRMRDDPVDILVVSAFGDDYSPAPGSLIEALHGRGLAVSALARDKEVDLRATTSCWLSKELPDGRGEFGFGRVLCYEPAVPAAAAEAVGDVFRALMPFVGGSAGMGRVAMPILASGYLRRSVEEMLPAMLYATVRWVDAGLPLERLRIVVPGWSDATEARTVFAEWVAQEYPTPLEDTPLAARPYDVFVSYARSDGAAAAEQVFEDVRSIHRDIRVFHDTNAIDTGASWQQAIYDSLNQCRKFVAVLTPGFLVSKVCQEELNIALLRRRRSEEDLMFPLYVRSAELPPHIEILNYVDCREADPQAIHQACVALARSIR